MKGLLVTALFFICVITSLYGQGELNEQQRIFFRNERTFGFLLNSDGWAVSYREGKRIDFLNKRLFEIDLGEHKHPKEVKLQNPYYDTPGSFIFGKTHCNTYIRVGIGRQHEIFKKADLGGVAVRYFYTGGPVLAFYKPIYYKVLYFVSSTEAEIREEKFDITKHEPSMIYSKSSVTKGLNETKLLPGLYGKAGFNFEYSKQDKVLHMIEVGAQVNAYPAQLPIMATESNKYIYLSLFVSYRLGVVIDPMDPNSRKFSSIFRRKGNQ